jgi:hypothetical protein
MYKSFCTTWIVLVIASILMTCDNYEFPKSPYPRIETLPVVDLDKTAVTFQAKITQLGIKPIISQGFIWGVQEALYPGLSEKSDFGAASKTGLLEQNIADGLYADTTYYVKAYLITDSYSVYGKVIAFRTFGQ